MVKVSRKSVAFSFSLFSEFVGVGESSPSHFRAPSISSLPAVPKDANLFLQQDELGHRQRLTLGRRQSSFSSLVTVSVVRSAKPSALRPLPAHYFLSSFALSL